MSAGYLEDAEGNKSSSRLIVVLVVVVVMSVWAYVSIKTDAVSSLPWEVVALLFVCILGKNATGYLLELKNNMLTKS